MGSFFEGFTLARLTLFRLIEEKSEPTECKTDELASLEVRARIEALLEQEFGLGAFGKVIVRKWLTKMGEGGEGLKRVRGWFLCLLEKRFRLRLVKHVSKWQLGCPDLVPHLRSKAFWTPEEVDALELERSFKNILQELESMKGKPIVQPYRSPTWANPDLKAADGVGSEGNSSGDWNVLYLFLHNLDFKENLDLFPQTVDAINSIPNWYCHAFFSVLSPNTHIEKHHGPTNKKLRVHVPLVVPEGGVSGIRVGDETIIFEKGKLVVFDDSFEHEAWNNHSSKSRICLIVDVWHPDFSIQEINLLKFLEKGKLKLAKRVCDEEDVKDGSNFFHIIQHARDNLKTKLDF